MDSYLILIPAQPNIVVSSLAFHFRPVFLLMGFFLLGQTKWVKWKLLSRVQLFVTPWTYTVHGILQARILELVAFPFPRGSFNPGIKPRSPTLQAASLPAEKGSPAILKWVPYPFCSRSSNTGIKLESLLHCRQILYQLSIREAPWKKSYDKPRQCIKKQRHHFAD